MTAIDLAPDRAEAGNDESPNHENEKVRQVSAGNFEGVVGLRKEVVEAQPGQDDRHHGGSVARVPGGDGDGEGEDRHFHAPELIVLQSEGQAERDCDIANEIERARISMMARSSRAPSIDPMRACGGTMPSAASSFQSSRVVGDSAAGRVLRPACNFSLTIASGPYQGSFAL